MPIVPADRRRPRRAMALCEAALRGGVFAQAIRPPTVPEGTSRLRLVAMASHREDDLLDAAHLLNSRQRDRLLLSTGGKSAHQSPSARKARQNARLASSSSSAVVDVRHVRARRSTA